jgi:2-polyprenyl-3-methyl-5-hydroxy-6-metoxy-1,4-benzoquinol methylase
MNNTNNVKEFLSKPDIHQKWISSYRNKENEAFFNSAFNKIIKLCSISKQDKILDAGCGSGNHATRMAKKGYNITAIDFSESVLKIAQQNLIELNLLDKVTLQQEDLTALSFADNSFDIAYCWGVLMHIPDVETAIKELCRVVKPGGHIIISETNENSAEAFTRRALATLAAKNKNNTTIKTERGVENWYDKGDTKFFVRQSNVGWLTKAFLQNNAIRKHRLSGQFSEAYTSFGNSSIRKIIHAFNNFWIKRIRLPQLALGNILIFKKV